MTAMKPQLRTLTQSDLPKIAEVHIAAFPHAAITKLGHEAVRRYYDWQFTGPHDLVAIGTFEGDRLIGILFAGVFRGALTGFVRKNALFLTTRLLVRPWLIVHEDIRTDLLLGIRLVMPKAAKKTSVAALQAPKTNAIVRYFGSLSLAVHPDYRGLAAIMMVREIERIALERHFGGVNLVTHPDNITTTKLYTMMGYDKVIDKGEWRGGLRKTFATPAIDMRAEQEK